MLYRTSQMKRCLFFIGHILIVPILLFAQVPFSDQIIIQKIQTNLPTDVYAADLDGDGGMDVLSASFEDDKIAWYENSNGTGTFGSQQVITNSANGAYSVYAADLDGDGDMDVLSASYKDDKIAWYENIDGHGNFGPQQVITTSADGAVSVYSTDLDGDGDMDVLSASYHDDKIAWYENIDGHGNFSFQHVITLLTDGARSVYAADLDGDGDMDVLSVSDGDDISDEDDIIAWYENMDGHGNFGSQNVIVKSAYLNATSVYAEDLDNDGDTDVLSALYNGKITWYENIDGQGSFGSQQVITTSAEGAWSIYAVDLDDDGDLDVLSASVSYDTLNGEIAWYENIDGQGNFGTQQVITTSVWGVRSVYAEDLDNDGDMDVLLASQYDHKIAWCKNIDGKGNFGAQNIISKWANKASSVYASDLDSDGDMDVLSASDNDDKIAWYENIDGHGNFSVQNIITTSANGARSVYATDLDGDGDMDVLSASYHDHKIAWYENIDGCGSFGSQNVITTLAHGAVSVYATDLDGDGDVDVLSASYYDDKIAWYENRNGHGNFGPQQVITTSTDWAMSVYAEDLDNDGDMDVLSASSDDDKIAWYENIDGYGSFGPQQVITTSTDWARSVYATDLDGDGDMDVLSASASKIAWYENIDGQGNFGSQNIITTSADGAWSIYGADLDSDGDMDVLSASRWDDKIAWYENIDGLGNFGGQNVITTLANGAMSVYGADLDGDGDIDVLSASRLDHKIAWYRNLSMHPPPFPDPPNPHAQIVFSDNFEDGDFNGWVMKDPSRWSVGNDWGSQVCYINTTNYPPGPNDRLGEYGLIQDMDYGGFTFSCRARTRENLSSNGFADFCVVFNYQSENDYWYMMFNSGESETALYQIYSGDRKLIEMAPDFRIGDTQFHDIQMIRVENEIWVMINEQVIMYSDKIAGSGQIGLGSYNDAASFDDVVIKAKESPTYPPFPINNQVLFYDNCNGDGSEHWIEKTGKRWKRSGAYELFDTDYKPGDNKRLGEYSVIRHYELDDFTFTCRAKSNEDFMENPYGDFCLLVNFQDDDHYDYMMFNRAPYASKLYRIIPTGRTEISAASYDYRIEDNLFHDISLIRKGGQVWVKYDSEVVLYAEGFSGKGKAGVGSYNDAACFDDITVMVDSLEPFPHENHAPYANHDSVQVFQSGSIRIFVLSNDGDVDGDDLTVVSLDTTESLGDCVFESGDTTVFYTPLVGFSGEDSFGYVVGDGNGGLDTGLVVIDVIVVNHSPVALNDTVRVSQDSSVKILMLENDTDLDGDALSIVSLDTTELLGCCVIESGDTTVTYTPPVGFVGEDSFGYVVSDGRGGLDTGLVVIDVLVINHPPIAVDDSVTIKQDSTVVIDMLKNDSDPDGDTLSVVSIDTTGSLGYCVIESGDTTVTYTPPIGFVGDDSFGYVVGDGKGGLDTGLVVIIVEPITSLSEHQSLPTSFGLHQNFPNPFNPTTVINYQLPVNSHVYLVVYNIKGEKVRNLVEEQKSGGVHSVIWDGRDQSGQMVSTGVYIYRMETENYTEARKITFLR